ncbi:hypothetical protein PWT90_01687 [Aphanocladium album]|nr:hypothetical protein PWT90_01687 [Aphanocladium album]
MSSSKTKPPTVANPTTGNKSTTSQSITKGCAVFFGRSGELVAASPGLGVSKITARYKLISYSGGNSYIGFTLSFPLPAEFQRANHLSGHGIQYTLNSQTQDAVLASDYIIGVRFPRNATILLEDIPLAHVHSLVGPTKNPRSMMIARVQLQPGSPAVPMPGGHTLAEFLAQQEFTILLDLDVAVTNRNFGQHNLRPPFAYPYAPPVTRELSDYKDQAKNNPGQAFLPRFDYSDSSEFTTVVNHATLQDVMWIDDIAIKLRETKMPAYFAVLDSVEGLASTQRFYVVVAMNKQCELVLNRENIANFDNLHPTHNHELVLRVQRPPANAPGSTWHVKAFGSREVANRAYEASEQHWESVPLCFDSGISDAMRKVDAAFGVQEDADPTDMAAFGIVYKYDKKKLVFKPGQEDKIAKMDSSRLLHRSLNLGRGFYIWMSQSPTPPLSFGTEIRPLPVANWLDIGNETLVRAIIDEAVPSDRARFRAYLSKRPLGLALIVAGPDTGQTTCLAVVCIAMRLSIGPILGSAPTSMATDYLAERIDVRSRAVVQRYQQNGGPIGEHRPRQLLVVRAYNIEDQTRALRALLENPELEEDAVIAGEFKTSASWKKHLSLAYWALTVLESPAGEKLHMDASLHLWSLHTAIDQVPRWTLLRDIAAGKLTFQKAVSEGLHQKHLEMLMQAVLEGADVVCCTPAGFHNNQPLENWKWTVARGIVVNDAASMHIPDLLSVWGNCMRNCALAGDPKQLPPVVATKTELLADGSLINRFAASCKNSPLLYYMTMGIPVYRLEQQLRMANGLFDMVSKIINPDVPLSYAPGCAIDLPRFKIGRDLETFMLAKFSRLRNSPVGKLLPIFVHCRGTVATPDPATGSLRNPGQAKVALDLVAEFVTVFKADPRRIALITPYVGNVDTMKYMLRSDPAYAILKGIRSLANIDSFQGSRENDIVFVVMGTTGPTPGPGFTTDEQRLNVMLTLHRCGLVIVGDLYVVGNPSSDGGKVVVMDAEGRRSYKKATALKAVHAALLMVGRVATI